MIPALIIVASLLSCFLFTKMGLTLLTSRLIKSYVEVAAVMKQDLQEQEKQKRILVASINQFKLIGLILLRMVIILLPFAIAYICYNFIHKTGLFSFFSIQNSIISLVTVLVWILVEKNAKK